jgi:hypothetical protein
VELAAGLGAAPPSGLISAAISGVFTIGYVAGLLGEDEDWLHELSIECLKQIIDDKRASGTPPELKSPE